MKYDIVTIGSATRDVFMSAEDFVELDGKEFVTGEGLCLPLGSKIEIKKLVFATGGGGTNAAVTFGRQGFKTSNIGVIGNDANGVALLDELKLEGIDVSCYQKHDDDITAYSVILVQKNGERTILSYKGEGQHFSAANIDFDGLESDWVYVDSLGGHTDLMMKILDWAKSKNIKIATDPGTKEVELGLEALKPLFAQAAIVHMNREDAAKVAGLSFDDEENIFKTLDAAVPGIFVMSNGHEGVMVSDGKNLYRAGVPDSPVVERTGAGDAFTSGFVAEYMRSADIVKAIQFGTANASSVVTQFGSKAGILKKGD
ncbi:MAG TPA: carbohydrate kinase family protein, partial [Candidatus Paceibacterota bacterium]|nr:carbohydrate kinase family protein [Candidatus Paceibacterota bacterium]